ncbi:disease resistance protein RLM3-like [Neltuma alba]|uniref:disease resistance protein RLM3-like n=1 Tax=Neltuma alba TaxID=207710 RepID=UPI0010A4C03F|nr:disease resistance protein RLM3-like [Prosopis alba]
MALVAASSSSSAQSLRKKYDVFISFRGEDTRFGFTSHLYHAFDRKGITTYIDYQLVRGDEIAPSLLQAIEDSYVSLVVFSENYASSRWCLDELAHIRHCKRDQGQIVIPVFFKVDPSHVRNQTGLYQQAFERYERDLKVDQHKMQMWKQALNETANLAGHDSRTFRDEFELIQKIIKDILQKLNHKYPQLN